jgi:hypothetical protein
MRRVGRRDLKQMTRAAKHLRDPFPPIHTETSAKKHVAGIEETHRFVAQDIETVGAKMATPPAGMK